MKVLILAQYFPPDMGGASTRVSNLVKGLLSKDCSITVVAAFPHYPNGNIPFRYKHKALVRERVGDIDVLRVWIAGLPHNTIINRVLLHLCFVVSSFFAMPFVSKVDVVIAANPNLFCFFPALVYGLAKRAPIIRNVDDLWPEVFYELGIVRSDLTRMLLDFLAKLSYVIPAAIIPISAGYKRKIMERYGVIGKKVHVVEVGVDAVEATISHHEDRGQFVVMYSGVLGVGYDFETVLRAAVFLSKYENIVFFIRGVGELAPELKRLIQELKLGNVILDTSFLPREKLSTLLKSADVFVLPMSIASLVDEGLPTKVFEYQAYGKPIICVSDGEPARYIRATKAGLIVKPKNAGDLAAAVIRLYEDKKLAAELGWNGWQHVSKNLTSERIGERIYDVFLSINA